MPWARRPGVCVPRRRRKAVETPPPGTVPPGDSPRGASHTRSPVCLPAVSPQSVSRLLMVHPTELALAVPRWQGPAVAATDRPWSSPGCAPRVSSALPPPAWGPPCQQLPPKSSTSRGDALTSPLSWERPPHPHPRQQAEQRGPWAVFRADARARSCPCFSLDVTCPERRASVSVWGAVRTPVPGLREPQCVCVTIAGATPARRVSCVPCSRTGL